MLPCRQLARLRGEVSNAIAEEEQALDNAEQELQRLLHGEVRTSAHPPGVRSGAFACAHPGRVVTWCMAYLFRVHIRGA